MKPGKHFNLSKESKRALAQLTNPEAKGNLKRMLIQAELAAAVVPKREKRPLPQGNAGYKTNDTGTASTSAE